MKIADFSIKHPVIITILLAAALVFGVISLLTTRQEMFPDVEMPTVMIVTQYPGVGPRDVEKEITDIIEEAISSVSGIDSISSSSADSVSIVEIQFDWNTDLDSKLPELREGINEILDDLPDGVEGIPGIVKYSASRLPILSIVAESEMDRAGLTDFVEEQVVPQILRITGVSQVKLNGKVEPIVNIKLHTDLVQSRNIAVLDILQTLQYNNVSFPAGSISFKGKELNLRTFGDFTTLDEIENMVVGFKGGSYIRLKDVADVSLSTRKPDEYTFGSGESLLVLDVLKQQDKDTIEIIKKINAKLRKVEKEYNNLVVFKAISDQAYDVSMAITAVRNSAIQGAILAILILFIFLRNIRATLIIAVSIPLSLLLTFIAMTIAGKSINLMTLGGLTVGIGMIVDSSIVVMENIHKIYLTNPDRKQASSIGVSEVGGAIIASTSTSLAVFVPLIFSTGVAGIFLKDVSMTVIFSLSSSLLVAVVVVPFLCALFLKENHHIMNHNIITTFSDLVEKGLNILEKLYKGGLNFVLKNRPFIFVTALCVLVLSFFVFNFIGFEFMAESDMNELQIKVKTPIGYSLEETREKTILIEEILRKEVPEIESVVFYIGRESSYFSGGKTSNACFGRVRLVKNSERKRDVFEIIDRLRGELRREIPDIEVSVINGGLGALASIATGGQGFMIEVYGTDMDKVYQTALMVEELIKEDENIDKTEMNVRFDREEMIIDLSLDYMGDLGVSPREAAVTSRILFNGVKSGLYRTSGKNYDIYLDSDLVDKNITGDILDRLAIRSQSGKFISFANISNIRLENSPSVIKHRNKQKSIIVTGYMKKTDFRALTARIIPRIEQLSTPIGVNWEIAGQAKEMGESFGSLLLALLVAVFLIYAVMVIQFEKFSHPLIVMFSVPFTLIGVSLGLLVFGSTFTIVAFLGIIMLAGIVVNNAIVMIDYINLLRTKYGKDLLTAVIDGGSSRLIPILMTTLTTVLGVIPMALGAGEGAKVYASLAQAVAGGLLTSTLITLFLVPAIYYSIEQWKEHKWPAPSEEALKEWRE